MTEDAWHDPDFAETWDEAGNLRTNPDRTHQLALLADLLDSKRPAQLLDLGIGSAQVEAFIKRRHPQFFDHCSVTGLDASRAMLELASKRLAHEQIASVELLQRDFDGIGSVALDAQPDAAICVQALHEVPHDTKRELFAWVKRQLPADRPFYILDRFYYPDSPWLDDWKSTWDWMRSNIDNDTLDFDSYHEQYSAKTDHIARIEDYRNWLEDAGFVTLCPYQCFNRALIIART